MGVHKDSRSKVVLLCILSLLFFSACARKTTVVLLPDPDGRVGQVVVTNDAGLVKISQANDATVIANRTSPPSPPAKMAESRIAADFSTALSALPDPPKHFLLYFEIESTRLTAKSKFVVDDVLNSIRQRESQDISVVGHTDTSGDKDYNMDLSGRRAEFITRLLIRYGVVSEHISTASRGEENPLVKTADNVYEPRNRRVEVIVR